MSLLPICPKINPKINIGNNGIKNFFKNTFTTGKVTQEKSVVWLSDPAGDTTAYNSAYKELTDAGAIVYQFTYKGSTPSQNIFYQANPEPATSEFIKNTLNATEVTLPPPGMTIDKSKVDLIVILGQNN